MTVCWHELKRGRTSLIIWSAAISFVLGICVWIYPEISAQMEDVSAMFAGMGSFSQAFGMDQINFGEFIGFFCVECGNILGLGGAFFAAILGSSALAREEKEKTAEFLLTHPVSRRRVLTEKLCAVVIQIVIFNAVAVAVTTVSVLMIGEQPPVGTLALVFLAYFLMQLEIAAITFGISAFLNRGGFGTGLGIAAVFYFLNIISNLTDRTSFLKYITPFGYTEGSDIIAEHALNVGYLAVGMVFAAIGIAMAFWRYCKKDIS